MVCNVGDVADLFLDRGRVGQLEREFIIRRNLVKKQVLDDPKKYLDLFDLEQLRDQKLMYNGLLIEASRMDDERRRIIGVFNLNPNYEQLSVMYQGVKNIIQREIKFREQYSSSF